MKRQAWIGAVLTALAAVSQGLAGEPGCCPPPGEGILQRFHPVGGWDPDGGGVLHWWNPFCFPRCGGPDDYCRKPFPCVCRPAYPAFYTWGPLQIGCSAPPWVPAGKVGKAGAKEGGMGDAENGAAPRVPPAQVGEAPASEGLHPGLYSITHKGLEEGRR